MNLIGRGINMKMYMIFGAGAFGKRAFETIGANNVVCFIDNDEKKQGSEFCGKTVMSLADALKTHGNCTVIIASLYGASMENQLREAGVSDYKAFVEKIHGFFETDELVVNNYTIDKEITEDEWNNSTKIELGKKGIYDEVERLHKNIPLFTHVEIETINRCNGVCSFCPVNKNNDTREFREMSDELFKKIVRQLKDIDYSGRVSLFSNNEPLLDKKILERSRYLRSQLKNARIHMFSNGTLMNIRLFESLVECLDELVIDNYQQELKLIKSCQEIAEYCEEHSELKKKVTIVLRKPVEVLTTRGGNAPNRKDIVSYDKERCILPYQQMIIRPDGKVSLCCNDALGEYTLGDTNDEKLMDIWYGKKFTAVREALYKGRENFGKCRYCDTFFVG